MKQILTRIILIYFFILINIFAQKSSKQQSDPILSAIHGVQSSSTENRLPELLNDAKVLLSDAFIADILSDTFEVVYNLNRIFDLLAEADQYGEMDIEDKEEFERFEQSLVLLYTKKFTTLDKVEAGINAENMRMDVTSMTEPLKVEMGATCLLYTSDAADE